MITHSTINIPGGFDVEYAARQIEAVTRGKVEKISISDGRATFYIVHHDGPRCPHCDEKIHEFGHGLCLKCWIEFRGGILK